MIHAIPSPIFYKELKARDLTNTNRVEKRRLVRHPNQEIILFPLIFADLLLIIACVQSYEKLIVDT